MHLVPEEYGMDSESAVWGGSVGDGNSQKAWKTATKRGRDVRRVGKDEEG